jgi:hypothetical protein
MRVKRAELARALKLVRKALDPKSPIPAYRSVRMLAVARPDGLGLKISGTDGQMSLSVEIGAQTGVGGLAGVVVEAEKLAKWVEADQGEDVDLRVTEKHLVLDGGGRARLAVDPFAFEEYPEIFSWPNGVEAVAWPRMMVDDLVETLRFANPEDTSMALARVVHLADGWLLAADGHRAVRQASGWDRGLVRWLGQGAVGMLAALVDKGEEVEVAVEGRKVLARGADYLLSVRMEEGLDEQMAVGMTAMFERAIGEVEELSAAELEEALAGLAVVGSLWDRGERHGSPRVVELGDGKARLVHDVDEVEADVSKALPAMRTYWPYDVALVLLRAKSLATADGKVSVGPYGQMCGMRVVVEGVEGVRGELLLTGIQ